MMLSTKQLFFWASIGLALGTGIQFPLTHASEATLQAAPVAAKREAELARRAKLKTLRGYLEAIPQSNPWNHLPTVGVELEGSFPGISRDAAYEVIKPLVVSEFVARYYPGSAVRIEDFSFSTRRGEPRYGTKFIINPGEVNQVTWQIKDDGSIKPRPGHYGIEIVSPILWNKGDLEREYGLVQILKDAGFQPEEKSAALQVHAGFTDEGPLLQTAITRESTLAEVLYMTWVFSKIEKEIMRFYRVTPERQHFTMPTPEKMVAAIESGAIPLKGNRLYDVIESNYYYRYWALNLRALFQFGTVEIRFANSSTDVAQIEALADFGAKLVRAVRSKDKNLISLMERHIDEEIPLIELTAALGMKLHSLILDRKNEISQCERILQ